MALIDIHPKPGHEPTRGSDFNPALAEAARTGRNGYRELGAAVVAKLFDRTADPAVLLLSVISLGNQKPPILLPDSADYWEGAMEAIEQRTGVPA